MIEVNEEHVEGAAASAALIVDLIAISKDAELIVNKPFTYTIYHKQTSAIIFMG